MSDVHFTDTEVAELLCLPIVEVRAYGEAIGITLNAWAQEDVQELISFLGESDVSLDEFEASLDEER